MLPIKLAALLCVWLKNCGRLKELKTMKNSYYSVCLRRVVADDILCANCAEYLQNIYHLSSIYVSITHLSTTYQSLLSLRCLLWQLHGQENAQKVEDTSELLCCATAAVLVLSVFLPLSRCFFKSHFLRDNWICHPWLSALYPICYRSYYSCCEIPQTVWLEMCRAKNIWLWDWAFKPYLILQYG